MKKSYTVPKPEWWKHLRKEKKTFWKRQRVADAKNAEDQYLDCEKRLSPLTKIKKSKSFHLEWRYKDGIWKKYHAKYKSERDRENALIGLNKKSNGFEYRIPPCQTINKT